MMKERDEEKPLSSYVEIDDVYWGGKKKGKRGRGSESKTPFLVAVEKDERGHPVNIKLNVVSAFKKEELKRWSMKHLVTGATVISDGLNYFLGIQELATRQFLEGLKEGVKSDKSH